MSRIREVSLDGGDCTSPLAALSAGSAPRFWPVTKPAQLGPLLNGERCEAAPTAAGLLRSPSGLPAFRGGREATPRRSSLVGQATSNRLHDRSRFHLSRRFASAGAPSRASAAAAGLPASSHSGPQSNSWRSSSTVISPPAELLKRRLIEGGERERSQVGFALAAFCALGRRDIRAGEEPHKPSVLLRKSALPLFHPFPNG